MCIRPIIATAICLTSLAACTDDTSRQSAGHSTSTSETTLALTEPNSTRDEIGRITRDPLTAPDPTGPPVPFAVEGRPLPSAVVSVYRSGGGQLLQNSDVLDGHDLREFPYPAAVGVVVTDVTAHITVPEPGLIRRDEGVGWLLVDDRTLGELLDGLAASARITTGGWRQSATNSTISGANCSVLTYTNGTTPVAWSLSGCTYPEFAGLRAVQVQRTGTFRDPDGALPAMPAIVGGPISATEATAEQASFTLTGWGFDFTHPGTSGITTTVTVHFDTTGDPTPRLRASLPGWTELPADEDHGVRFQSGADEWEVTSDGVVFTHRGRFPA